MMRTHVIAPLAALLILAACSPDFDGPEKVKGLRVLAVRAEPPELGATLDGSGTDWPDPGSTIQALVGHPAFAADDADHAVVLHLACTPTPGDPLGTVCTQISALSQPSELLGELSTATACPDPGAMRAGVLGGITVSGLEACNRSGCRSLAVQSRQGDAASVVDFGPSTYQLPGEFSLGLPAGNTQRVLGTDVVVLSFAVEADPAELTPEPGVDPTCSAVLPEVLRWFAQQWPLRTHVASLKWIHVRGPDMPAASKPNENPPMPGIRIRLGENELPLLTAAPLAVDSGKTQDLLPVLPGDCRLGGSAPPTCFDGLRQQYQRFDTDGHYLDTKEEDWAYSWFGTAGDFDQPHTTSFDEKNTYKLGSGRAMIWLVVRDLRGGESWTAGEVQVP